MPLGRGDSELWLSSAEGWTGLRSSGYMGPRTQSGLMSYASLRLLRNLRHFRPKAPVQGKGSEEGGFPSRLLYSLETSIFNQSRQDPFHAVPCGFEPIQALDRKEGQSLKKA